MFVRKPAVTATPVADAVRKLGSKMPSSAPSPEKAPKPKIQGPSR